MQQFLIVNSPHKELADNMESQGHKIVRVKYQPTSEMIIIDFANKIKSKLPRNIRLKRLILRETETCYAEWHAEKD